MTLTGGIEEGRADPSRLPDLQQSARFKVLSQGMAAAFLGLK
jgi:hypothetical protein